MTEALKRAQKKYNRKIKQFSMRMRKDRDEDIIAWIDGQASASNAVKELIREKIRADI